MRKPYERKVQYYETDQMGIVHHSNYIRWFEEARMEYLEQLGISYAEMETAGVLIPVLSVSSEYKILCRYPERIQIEVKLRSFDGIRMSLEYVVREADSQKVRCTGSSGHCFLDRKYHPVSLKRSYPKWYEILLEAAEEDGE